MNSIIRQKSFAFAIRIVRLYKHLTQSKKEFILSKQLLRCGTSIGALCYEAEHAQSRADFINKMNISLKEANEVIYWITLLRETDYLEGRMFESIYSDGIELVRLLASIVKTTKQT